MKASAWSRLKQCLPESRTAPWLESMLKRNANCAYLKQWGQPTSMEDFRNQLPLTDYDQLEPWIKRMTAGESSLLFPGNPVAFEKTGGCSGGCKLIPYTGEGLSDFRGALLPWLSTVASRHQVTGSAYFSLSPVCRNQERIAGIPVGLSDIAYLGERAGTIFADICAVPPAVGELTDNHVWRTQTLHYLRQAKDLELISAWSPTFLLKLFEEEETEAIWPELKVISCWTRGASAEFADALQSLFPHVTIEPKGLMSTEAAITVPNEQGKPLLTDAGFFEFRSGKNLLLEGELKTGETYEVVVTTANGLYRYCTGDMLKCEERTSSNRAVLQFMGRQGLTSDLVGEKLTDSFVGSCLKGATGFRMLVPDTAKDGYLLIVDQGAHEVSNIETIENGLMNNPQYAYARKLGQLKPLTVLPVRNPWKQYERQQIKQGIRLGDIKPVSLRPEQHWANLFRKQA